MKEQKQIRKIRKVINFIENLALFTSCLGGFGLITVVFLAPQVIENGNYYAALFASIGAILTAPALAWIEDAIKESGKGEEDAE